MIKRIRNELLSILFVSGWYYVCYQAVINNSENFQNLMMFFIGVIFIGSLLLLFSKETAGKVSEKQKIKLIPFEIYSFCSLVVAGILIYYGWFWCGGIYFFSTIVCYSVRKNAIKEMRSLF